MLCVEEGDRSVLEGLPRCSESHSLGASLFLLCPLLLPKWGDVVSDELPTSWYEGEWLSIMPPCSE